jgi:hypothetical protein
VELDVEARVRKGVKAVLEEVIQEEMSEHLFAAYSMCYRLNLALSTQKWGVLEGQVVGVALERVPRGGNSQRVSR